MREIQQTLGELIAQYTRYRRLWIAWFGTADGFAAWFTHQVTKA